MRWLPKAIPILIAIIALDFAMVFGFASFRILTSPVYGLDQLVFANLIHGIGRLAGLQAYGLYNLAAFFGAVYLTIAAVFSLHIVSRIRALRLGPVAHDLLDAGLILVVISTLFAATPAIMQGASDILVQERLPLWLVGLAATLSMIERLPETDTHTPTRLERMWARFSARRKGDESRRVSPVVRDGAEPVRWNSLRSEAGLVVQPASLRKFGPWFQLRLR